MLNNECNAKCEICCFDCSANDKSIIDMSAIKRYIKSSKDIKEIKAIGISGGEPFQDYTRLFEIVEYSFECGKNISIITNGGWAQSYSLTKERIICLKKYGVNLITISRDEFHEKFVSDNCVINIIKACDEGKIKCAIQSVLVKNGSLEWFERIRNCISSIEVDFINCIPVGRAKKLTTLNRPLYSNGLFCQGCSSISVSTKGDIYPCNSVVITSTELIIGNIYNDNVRSSLNSAYHNGILSILRNKGFDYFIDIAKKVNIEIPDKVSSACELCSILFNSKNIIKIKPYIVLDLLNQRR